MATISNNDTLVIDGRIRVRRRGKRGIFTAEYRNAGVHCRRSLETRNRREAERRAWTLHDKLDVGGDAQDIKPVTLEEGMEMYLSYLSAEGRSRKTLVKYNGELTRLIAYVRQRGVKTPEKITPLVYDQYRSDRVKIDKIALYTAHNLAILSKQWLRYLVSRRLIHSNPLEQVKLRMPRRRRYPAATIEQIRSIRTRVTAVMRDLFDVLAFTGMRLGEVLNLHIEHLDLENQLIRLTPIGELRLKTEAAQREIPIHPVLTETLRRLAGRHRRGLLFVNKDGTQINPRLVNTRFVEAAAEFGFVVGLKNIGLTVHSLRRFFKTTCYDSGIPKPLIDRWLGHADRSMDAFYYDPNKSHEWMKKLPFETDIGCDHRSSKKE